MSAEASFVLDGVTLGNPPRFRVRVPALRVAQGVTAVLGWSGAGKTSLLNLLAGFEQPAAGTCEGPSRVAWVPQNDGLWPQCSALEHLTETGASAEEAENWLARFDLSAVATRLPATLSRGEQSRLSVARALAAPVRVWIMDEPLSHVDPARRGKYWQVIRERVAATEGTLIFSTHAPEIALAEANHAICLHDGELVYAGAMNHLYHHPATESLAVLLGPTNWIEPANARQWLGAEWEHPRSVRPESLHFREAAEGLEVMQSRFCGAYAETEVRAMNGDQRSFLHRPSAPMKPGVRVQLVSLLLLLLCFFVGCSGGSGEKVLAVKSSRSWMLPADGPTQPTPRSLTVGPKDELAVMDTAGRILIYDAQGVLQRQWKMLDVQFGKPEGIVWLKDGRLVVCDTHYHRLVWFNQEGKVLHMVGTRGFGPSQFVFPVGITKDPDENLYVCEYGGHDRVQVFSREGAWLREFGRAGSGPGQFQRPSGLAWLAGRMYVTDAVNHRVLIFKEDGTYEGLLGANSEGASALAFNLPYDITLGPDGAFYVIEYGAGRLTKVTADGQMAGRFGKTGDGKDEFATPWGLTVDSQMRVFIADTKNRRIVMLQL